MNSEEVFATIANCWKLLFIVIKSYILDIDRVFESVSDRELNIVLDLKLKFIILSVT